MMTNKRRCGAAVWKSRCCVFAIVMPNLFRHPRRGNFRQREG